MSKTKYIYHPKSDCTFISLAIAAASFDITIEEAEKWIKQNKFRVVPVEKYYRKKTSPEKYSKKIVKHD